jgi:hypothetical protein
MVWKTLLRIVMSRIVRTHFLEFSTISLQMRMVVSGSRQICQRALLSVHRLVL